MSDKLIEVASLCKYFSVKEGLLNKKYIYAVDDLSFFINRGETLGMVGESGCGKSTLGRTLIRLYEPTSGRIVYDGQTIYDSGNIELIDDDGNKTYSKKQISEIMPFRRKMQIIFQDPSASLNDRMTVGEIIKEPLEIHNLYPGKKERNERVKELLHAVGLTAEHATRYPHEFSGGQQQRIGIARALAVEPGFIVCDEPISALDVSIQSQIINMLEDMQNDLGLTYLFIAHDISVVRHISNRIGVMYLGKLVELGKSNEISKNPLHPYTKTLLSSVPIPDPKKTRENKRIVLQGDIPNPISPPLGCRFHTRCPCVKQICKEQVPPLRELSNGHFAACHIL
ncbi:MAG: ATP-binding cassette domain-containing protein [Oscillospiraceae bacterium]|jgi:oligopeptide transport system ATP-binding protein|nr:ATP-binding cassette domain-containing protein [Oscillospiraceae bacterium]